VTRAFGVYRIYDSGRRVIVRRSLLANEAARVAGQLRDAMTDSQVGQALAEGWNYLPAKITAAERVKARVHTYIANNRTAYQSRTQHKIATEIQRLSRKGVDRATT
jgi:hypothetical protein